ncbi:helix-turn-helix transcriptional regulator [Asanoa sp. WMMD1127]|uniref:helix-turn-helix domain-containing protein n=1 Tax=Asanoa sp. WMMD1127 TaxID=3016107 RepID=UPI0024177A6C|nr:helix-turn-helix transcriptional regulator [Asanoa sp. WMMD1127]MDG4821837.1 helix-turn-helix transcriptional regulator [Asanoa sp. WMMD1127]
MTGGGPSAALAERLRRLRLSEWSSPVKQQQLARALGVSVPLISSWERTTDPRTPPSERLAAYARFFATQRSLDGGKPGLRTDLSPEEETRRRQLEDELLTLRDAAGALPGPRLPDRLANLPPRAGPWYFADGAPVTIVCGELPAEHRADPAYTDPDSPDYVALYNYADLDSLVELHGHVRAANPQSDVWFMPASLVTSDHLTTHLVLLGGVDFNDLTTAVLDSLGVPVRQQTRLTGDPDDEGELGFEVREGAGQSFRPVLHEENGGRILVEDVAHLCRGQNPYNALRTVTVCNGMFGRGVYGAVRTLTDKRFRDRNANHMWSRVPDAQTFSILFRVRMVMGEVVTPDWTRPENVLHEWSA